MYFGIDSILFGFLLLFSGNQKYQIINIQSLNNLGPYGNWPISFSEINYILYPFVNSVLESTAFFFAFTSWMTKAGFGE